MNRKINRGAVHKNAETTFLGAYAPDALVALVDQAVRRDDTDRSKFIRAAIKEKLAASGYPIAA